MLRLGADNGTMVLIRWVSCVLILEGMGSLLKASIIGRLLWWVVRVVTAVIRLIARMTRGGPPLYRCRSRLV